MLRGYFNYYGVYGNFFQPGVVFLQSYAAADEIPESTPPTRQLQLGRVPTTDRTIRDREASYHQTPPAL